MSRIILIISFFILKTSNAQLNNLTIQINDFIQMNGNIELFDIIKMNLRITNNTSKDIIITHLENQLWYSEKNFDYYFQKQILQSKQRVMSHQSKIQEIPYNNLTLTSENLSTDFLPSFLFQPSQLIISANSTIDFPVIWSSRFDVMEYHGANSNIFRGTIPDAFGKLRFYNFLSPGKYELIFKLVDNNNNRYMFNYPFKIVLEDMYYYSEIKEISNALAKYYYVTRWEKQSDIYTTPADKRSKLYPYNIFHINKGIMRDKVFMHLMLDRENFAYTNCTYSLENIDFFIQNFDKVMDFTIQDYCVLGFINSMCFLYNIPDSNKQDILLHREEKFSELFKKINTKIASEIYLRKYKIYLHSIIQLIEDAKKKVLTNDKNLSTLQLKNLKVHEIDTEPLKKIYSQLK